MFKTIFTPILNFLFPAPDSVQDIESIPGENLVKILPPSNQNYPDIYSLFAYQDEKVKHLVWEIKYYKNEKVADQVGALLAQKIMETLNGKSDAEFLLIPIPLTDKRLKERGFNHTELIAISVLKYLPDNFTLSTTAMKKVRHTPKQNSIENREERFKNIENAFGIPDSRVVRGKHIIVIDDVVTTGATVGEAKKVLLQAGALDVRILTIAH